MQFHLYHFKNHTEKTLTFSDNLQLVVGDNGSGKSTLCEALTILTNTHNPHHTNWAQKCSFHETDWALRWQIGEKLFQGIFDGKTVSPKWYIDEGSVSKPKFQLTMPYRAFWIQSDHLRVISGEPTERRAFFDEMIAYAHPEYEKIVRDYRTSLTARNRVIQSILAGDAKKSDLNPWNTLFVEQAIKMILERRKFFTWFESQPIIELDLPGPVKIVLEERHKLDDISSETFSDFMREYLDRDIIVGRTTIGPHLDDIGFYVEEDDDWMLTKYILSRGENKTLLLSCIRTIGRYVEQVSGKKPLFLLDDVLSELDTRHTDILCELFRDTMTLMTTQPNHTAGLPGDIDRIEL